MHCLPLLITAKLVINKENNDNNNYCNEDFLIVVLSIFVLHEMLFASSSLRSEQGHPSRI